MFPHSDLVQIDKYLLIIVCTALQSRSPPRGAGWVTRNDLQFLRAELSIRSPGYYKHCYNTIEMENLRTPSQSNLHTGTYQSRSTRNLGPSVRICQLNVEGLSKAKSDHLARLLSDNDIDLAIIQETHINSESELRARGVIPGFTPIGAIFHRSYGSITYVRSTIENAELISATDENNIHLITTSLGNTKVVNIYKPPNVPWPDGTLPVYEHPAVYAGDFNSHHTLWKYASNDACGNALMDWAEGNNMHLVFDAKDRGTFNSARWRRDYNPDLCFVTNSHERKPLQTRREVQSGFPHSQHRPVILTIGVEIPLINSTPKPRWNFNKASWTQFSSDVDKIIRWIPPTVENYERFVGVVLSTAKKHIPRGFRKEYIPGWNEDSERLYQEFLEGGDDGVADELLHSLDKARRDKWAETVKNMNFTHSSRKAWGLLRKLGGGGPVVREGPTVSPDMVANHIVSTSRVPANKQHKQHTIETKRELSRLKRSSLDSTEYSRPFTLAEINEALAQIKNGKAAGYDGIYPEFLRHSGNNTRQWLCQFFNNILSTGNLPKDFKLTKIIALLKPGKPNDRAESFRPIALLSVSYKLLERLLYNRISPAILEIVPDEQAGFRPNRSCTDQVMALTSHIEAGFQRRLKTSTAFIDLTAAYDTVWRQGVVCKLLRIIPCKTTAKLIDNMLSNRIFRVHMNEQSSKFRKLNNGLPQGSVLAPLLFNLYISDLPDTQSRKFAYADDLAITFQHRSIGASEETLTNDLAALSRYFGQWRLRPSLEKTEVSCFHLNNRMASAKLSVYFNDTLLRHNPTPKYLGVTLDRTLSYRQHLTNTAAKLKTRNNILQRLTGTTWGASASVLRSTALGLVFPTAEYCAPVWLNSVHTKKVDVQLNTAMRLISGTIRSTPTYWLPALCNIAPPQVRRHNALLREHRKYSSNPELPIHADIPGCKTGRLKSRHPAIKLAEHLATSNFDPNEAWLTDWTARAPDPWHPILDPQHRPAGFDLPRHLWCSLNRIRTGHGRCSDSLFRWGSLPSPNCDCGASRQTISHIVADCPLRSYQGILSDFITVPDSVIDWLVNLDLRL